MASSMPVSTFSVVFWMKLCGIVWRRQGDCGRERKTCVCIQFPPHKFFQWLQNRLQDCRPIQGNYLFDLCWIPPQIFTQSLSVHQSMYPVQFVSCLGLWAMTSKLENFKWAMPWVIFFCLKLLCARLWEKKYREEKSSGGFVTVQIPWSFIWVWDYCFPEDMTQDFFLGDSTYFKFGIIRPCCKAYLLFCSNF